MFVNKWGANGVWYCLGYSCLVPSLLGGARRHPEVAFNSVSCKCRCFNCHTPDRHKQTNKQKIFQNLFLEKRLSYTWCRQEILPRAIKSNACASWTTRTSILAIGISVMNKITLAHVEAQEMQEGLKLNWKMQSRLKVREMQQEGSHAHHQIATKSNIMYQHLLYVVLVEILRLHLIPDGKLTHHLLWFIVLVLHGRSINQAHERKAFRLTCWLWWCCRPHHLPVERHKRHMQSSRLTSEEGRQPLSLSFSTLSNLLLHHAQLQVLLSKEQEQWRRRRQHCVHRDEQLRTHLQLLTWQRIALLLVLLLSYMMKKTRNLFFSFLFFEAAKLNRYLILLWISSVLGEEERILQILQHSDVRVAGSQIFLECEKDAGRVHLWSWNP